MVIEEMRNRLHEPFNTTEIAEALQALPKSCPGEDSLPHEFYINKWELIQDDLCAAFQEVMDSGVMPNGWSEGLIFLILKGDGPSEEIQKWWPITILNTRRTKSWPRLSA